MGSSSSKPSSYPFPVPGYEPVIPSRSKSKKWTLSKKSEKSKKDREYGDFIFPKYPTVGASVPYGVPYYPQFQSAYPAYYAPVQMAVVQPVGVQQPVLAMPQYVPVTTFPTASVQTAMAAAPVAPIQPAAPTHMPVPPTTAGTTAPPPPQPPVALPAPAPMPAPPPAPVLPIPQAPSTRMPGPYPTRHDPGPAPPPPIANQGPVIPSFPMGTTDFVIPPLPSPTVGDSERERPPGSARPRFTDFYRPANPPISRPPTMDEPAGPPPSFVTSMRNNPLPQPPTDVWDTSPYRQVLQNLPNDVTTLLDIQNREDILVTEEPDRSTSRLGGLFGSRRDKGKKPMRNLFRSFSTSGHDIQNEIGSSSGSGLTSGSRRGHHRSNTMTSIVIPAPSSSGSMPQPSVPGVPSSSGMPVPDQGPPVRFDHTGDYAGFVNHSAHRVLYGNKTYPTALHLLEAMKFTHRPDLQERIRTCANVNDMYPLSASFQEHVRPDWGQVFLRTMEDVLHLKFKQHPTLRALLMGTGLADIIYADTNPYWGEGPAGEGANQLGKALVQVRERLRQEGER